MQYAVFKSGSKQYKVEKGSILELDFLPVSEADKISFDQVMLVVSDDSVTLGTPLVKGAKITAKVLGQTRGEKINISKFKSKVRHRKSAGFRSKMTKILIDSIDHPSMVKKAAPQIIPKKAVEKQKKEKTAKKL